MPPRQAKWHRPLRLRADEEEEDDEQQRQEEEEEVEVKDLHPAPVVFLLCEAYSNQVLNT